MIGIWAMIMLIIITMITIPVLVVGMVWMITNMVKDIKNEEEK